MRTSRRTIVALVLGASALALPAHAFDGAPVNQQPAAGALRKTATTATAPAPETSSLTALQYAAEGGHPVAQWKLGRMYANGDGVTQDDVRAFALGRYYLSGIPNSKIKADQERARDMFSYAASYFGNADAQYDLARLYLNTPDGSREAFTQGARWLRLSAEKGQHQAQALLGQMLFNGDRLPRQAARGLMWLTLARDSAGTDETWIKEGYTRAFAKASDDDRAMCLQMLEQWVQGRRN